MEGLTHACDFEDVEDGTDFELLYLEQLDLWESVPTINLLLSYLNLPAGRDIAITCRLYGYIDPTEPGSFKAIPDLVDDLLDATHCGTPSRAILQFKEFPEQVSLEVHARSEASKTSAAACTLRVQCDYPGDDKMAASLEALLPSVLRGMTSLEISKKESDGYDEDRHWQVFRAMIPFCKSIGTLPALQSLNFRFNGETTSTACFLDALDSSFGTGSHDDTPMRSRDPFPALRSLTLHESRVESSGDGPCASTLVAWAHRRTQPGKTVSIVIDNCELTDDEVIGGGWHSRSARISTYVLTHLAVRDLRCLSAYQTPSRLGITAVCFPYLWQGNASSIYRSGCRSAVCKKERHLGCSSASSSSTPRY